MPQSVSWFIPCEQLKCAAYRRLFKPLIEYFRIQRKPTIRMFSENFQKIVLFMDSTRLRMNVSLEKYDEKEFKH